MNTVEEACPTTARAHYTGRTGNLNPKPGPGQENHKIPIGHVYAWSRDSQQLGANTISLVLNCDEQKFRWSLGLNKANKALRSRFPPRS